MAIPKRTAAILPELRRVIQDRKAHPKEGSYTNQLLNNEDKVLKKVVEEAGELAIAGKGNDRNSQIWEAADLIYHEMVLLEYLDLPMDEIYKKLSEKMRGGQKMRIDLHMHTLCSDGELLPIELARRAKIMGHEAIAFTDHVDLSNLELIINEEKKDLPLVKELDLDVILGCEIHPRSSKKNGLRYF